MYTSPAQPTAPGLIKRPSPRAINQGARDSLRSFAWDHGVDLYRAARAEDDWNSSTAVRYHLSVLPGRWGLGTPASGRSWVGVGSLVGPGWTTGQGRVGDESVWWGDMWGTVGSRYRTQETMDGECQWVSWLRSVKFGSLLSFFIWRLMVSCCWSQSLLKWREGENDGAF